MPPCVSSASLCSAVACAAPLARPPTRWPTRAGSYNQGQFDAAERAARDAARVPATADAARVVLGRIQLERYPATSIPADLTGAIAALRDRRCAPARCRASGSSWRSALPKRCISRIDSAPRRRSSSRCSTLRERWATLAHERVLDWWATAIDRQAQLQASRRPRRHVRPDRDAHGGRDFGRRRIQRRRATGWPPRRAALAIPSGR